MSPVVLLLCLGLGCGTDGTPDRPDATAPAATPADGSSISSSSKQQQQKKKKKSYDLGYASVGITPMARPDIEVMALPEVEGIAAEPGEGELSLVFVGDVLLGHKLDAYQAEHGERYAFQRTAPLLQGADLTVGNLEGVLIDTDAKPTKWSQRADTSTASTLAWAGFDAMTLGNNHFANYDDAGVVSTVQSLSRAGIGAVGVGPDPASARAPWVADVGGIKVAILGGVADSMLLDPRWLGDDRKIAQRHNALVRDLTHAGGRRQQATWLHTPDSIADGVAAARQVADIVVVDLHWGVIRHRPPFSDQVALATAAAAAGADLVLGEHAHIWQPAALVEGVPVVYGLGNFAMGFPSGGAKEGLVARAIVAKDTRRITRVELFPVATDNTAAAVDYQTPLLAGASARAVLDDLATWSRDVCDTALEVQADRAVLRVPMPDEDASAEPASAEP